MTALYLAPPILPSDLRGHSSDGKIPEMWISGAKVVLEKSSPQHDAANMSSILSPQINHFVCRSKSSIQNSFNQNTSCNMIAVSPTTVVKICKWDFLWLDSSFLKTRCDLWSTSIIGLSIEHPPELWISGAK